MALTKMARREFGAVGAFAAVAGAALLVARLASEISEGETRAFDTRIMLALRRAGDPAQPIGPAWLHHALLDITALGGTTVLTLLTLVVAGYLLASRRVATAAFVAAAVTGGALLNTVLKLGFARPRPELVAHLVQATGMSYPSGHAANSAATFLTLGALLARVEHERRVKAYILAVAGVLTLVVGCSRVYLGVHWPTDVLAGWAVGGAWALLCSAVALRLQQRRAIER